MVKVFTSITSDGSGGASNEWFLTYEEADYHKDFGMNEEYDYYDGLCIESYTVSYESEIYEIAKAQSKQLQELIKVEDKRKLDE